MTQRVAVILLIALVIAGAASFLVYRTVVRQARANAGPPTVQVLVAARNLEVGTLIKDIDLKTGNWAGELPKGILVDKKGVIGRGVVLPIFEGEPLNESRLAGEGAGGGLAATIPQGMRACAVRVNEVVGVAGFISPGMHVDVLIFGNAPGTPVEGGSKVRTLLQNIEVLSAGQNIQKDAEGKPVQVPVVNLLVTPEQAETLSLASNETKIQLVLRNPLDHEIEKVPGNAMANLFSPDRGQPKPAVARPAAKVHVAPPPPPKPEPVIEHAAVQPPPHRIEVLNGPKKSEAQFPLKMEAQQ
jgi:pilus assembly protein CpaB